jgi:hypothetical protein
MRPFELLLYGMVVFGWSTSWLPLKSQLGVVAPEVSNTSAYCAFGAMYILDKFCLFLSWRQGRGVRLAGRRVFFGIIGKCVDDCRLGTG